MTPYQKARYQYLRKRFYKFFFSGQYDKWPEEEKEEYIRLQQVWMFTPQK